VSATPQSAAAGWPPNLFTRGMGARAGPSLERVPVRTGTRSAVTVSIDGAEEARDTASRVEREGGGIAWREQLSGSWNY
jgi:hypothetical protein